MQGVAAVAAAQAQFEQRPLIGGVELLFHAPADLLHGVLMLFTCGAAQIGDGQRVMGHVGQDALRTLAGDHRAQHVVTLDQTVPCLFHPVWIEHWPAQFQVTVAGHVAVAKRRLAAQEVGVLHIGEREGRVVVRRVGLDQRLLLYFEQVQDLLFVLAQLCQALGIEQALGRAEFQLSVLGPEFDAQGLEFT
ncbi:hypothetical protein D3C76_1125960 [compost metagenome]